MGEHYGIWSVLPTLLAVALAMLTRRIVVSLLVGVFTAALVLSEGNPLRAFFRCITEDLFHSLIYVEHMQVFAFTLLMGGMVGVMHSSGAMRDLVLRLEHYASNRRRGQVFTWIAGLLIFFDDYANTLLLGTTFQPVADRLKISREKLAYIVDPTAAPVAGLAVISTWVAGEVQFIESGLVQTDFAGRTGLAFFIFIETILYRFYPILALLLVGFVAYSGRDFGPMRRAERLALQAASHPTGGTRPDELCGRLVPSQKITLPRSRRFTWHFFPSRQWSSCLPGFFGVQGSRRQAARQVGGRSWVRVTHTAHLCGLRLLDA